MIYLDNAATSWPKPDAVPSAVVKSMRESGGNPGRSGHLMSLNASRDIQLAREAVSAVFGIRDAKRIAFALNTTWALNMALKGVLRPGMHVVAGSMEHNSVMRPLRAMERQGVVVSKALSSPEAGLTPEALLAALRPDTAAVVTCHASNVSGALSPIAKLGAICRERGIVFIVDAAQSAGSLPIDVEAMGIDLLAFPGHKGLYGPQGTGGLYVAPRLSLETIAQGGTGTESSSLEQPEGMPERLESGTPNTPGLAGLAAGARWVLAQGVLAIGEREEALCARLIAGLSALPAVTVYGPPPGMPRASVVTISIRGVDPGDAAAVLDSTFGIAARAGLHCAPDAHEALGTLRTGALRLSPGAFTTKAEIDSCVDAIASLSVAMAT